MAAASAACERGRALKTKDRAVVYRSANTFTFLVGALAIVGALGCASDNSGNQREEISEKTADAIYASGLIAYSNRISAGSLGTPEFGNVSSIPPYWGTAGANVADAAHGLAVVTDATTASQQLFYLSSANSVLHRYSTSCATYGPGCWSSYGEDNWGAAPGGIFGNIWTFIGEVAAATNADQGIDIFVLGLCTSQTICGTSGLLSIFRRHNDVVNGLSAWTQVYTFTNDGNANTPNFDGLSAASSGPGKFDIFRVMQNGTVLHGFTTNNFGSMSTEYWSPPSGVWDSSLAATSGTTNTVDVYTIGYDFHLHQGHQVSGSAPSYTDLGAIPCTSPYGYAYESVAATTNSLGPGTVNGIPLAGVECELYDSPTTYHFELVVRNSSGWIDKGRLPSTVGGSANRLALASE